ncbi:hypothetical protein H6P81_002508 [Aristolochia fimbriata]|uniref:Secreted protein n=1 Tax=Aristolochia fimbriata TaxID=158543 RepID=A0AAV7F9Z1_ARIFI|nr:hypothetical protein H6P81_002508 [Aristolochia fimbriata]
MTTAAAANGVAVLPAPAVAVALPTPAVAGPGATGGTGSRGTAVTRSFRRSAASGSRRWTPRAFATFCAISRSSSSGLSTRTPFEWKITAK